MLLTQSRTVILRGQFERLNHRRHESELSSVLIQLAVRKKNIEPPPRAIFR